MQNSEKMRTLGRPKENLAKLKKAFQRAERAQRTGNGLMKVAMGTLIGTMLFSPPKNFLKECSKFQFKKGGRKYQCPCNKEE